mmetsp:Transcript_266/g.2110  ORF Transcript_266/g.2110 Transcript_266/m.2110 type:complete len:232 (-) Transcript_266:666-1361(-)
MHTVFPGVLDTRARFLRLVMALMRDDFPTFDRPTTANSGSVGGGHCSSLTLLFTNSAAFTRYLSPPTASKVLSLPSLSSPIPFSCSGSSSTSEATVTLAFPRTVSFPVGSNFHLCRKPLCFHFHVHALRNAPVLLLPTSMFERARALLWPTHDGSDTVRCRSSARANVELVDSTTRLTTGRWSTIEPRKRRTSWTRKNAKRTQHGSWTDSTSQDLLVHEEACEAGRGSEGR